MAAFDDAIADGVDLLSLSLGSFNPDGYFKDSVAVGSFHAMKKGILTSCSAGNSGPHLGTILNGAPWMLTVGASATDRVFKTPLKIGKDMEILVTKFIYFFPSSQKLHPNCSLSSNLWGA